MFQSIYYPAYNPPVKLFRSQLLFSDRLHIIVPEGVNPELHPANDAVVSLDDSLLGIERHFPTSFGFWQRYFQPLDRFFSQIAAMRGDNQFPIPTPIDGRWVLPQGYVFLHRNKLEPTMRRLLEKHGLINPCPEVDPDYVVAERRASSIVLALLADEIASHKGWHTVTEDAVPQLATVLTRPRDGHTMDALAAAILHVEIPDKIEDLLADQYLELRDRYATAREPFHKAIREVLDLNRIAQARTTKARQELVAEAAREFSVEIAKIRSASALSHVKRWVPFALGTVGAIAGVTADAIDDKRIAVPVSAAGGALAISMGVLSMFPQGYSPTRTAAQQLLANIQTDIFNAPNYKRLL